MKSVIAFSLVILALAQAERDWSKITHLDVHPFQRGHVNQADKPGSRIVGGEEVEPHSYPYQAALLLTIGDKQAFCGGSILNDEYILTAAHCLDPASQAEVIVGAHNIHEDEPTQQRFISTELIVHKGWNPLFLTSDIALVKLPEKIQFNDAVQPIRLPCYSDMNTNLANQEATVSGWGKDSDKATAVSPVLRKVSSKITSDVICKIAYFGIPGVNHLCMNGKGGKSSCSGDSGGPLVTLAEDGQRVQQGVVSFGLAFGCEIGWPSAYTRVSSFLKWINENTGLPVCE